MPETLFNIKLNIHDFDSVSETTEKFYDTEKLNTIYFLNAHCFNIAQKDNKYRNFLNQADLTLNDGIGISIASKFSKVKLKANVNGTDLTPMLLEQAAKLEKKVYLLGSEPGVTEKTKKVLEKEYPEIKIVGHHPGFFNEDEEFKIIEEINDCGAELLIVGMGVPRQEYWIEKNKAKIPNVKIAVGGGATMNFMSGHIKRAPKWMIKMKLEWFHRWLLEPKRMTNRYLIGNVKFFYYILLFKTRIKKN
jgi:N-acetylglucosaminyldiphosphoundecaprenol N-acetyl-beta-D-mannosaminyltransferase